MFQDLNLWENIHSTGTQIHVTHQRARKCKCEKEVNWVCDVSVCGPTDRVHKAIEELVELLPKSPDFGFEPSMRAYRHYVADVNDATQPAVDDLDRGRYIYPPLFYSVERREPLSKDAFGGGRGIDYIQKCLRDGVLYCRECAKSIVVERVAQDGDFETPPPSDPASTPTEFGQSQDEEESDWDARPVDLSEPSEPESDSKGDSQHPGATVSELAPVSDGQPSEKSDSEAGWRTVESPKKRNRKKRSQRR